MVPPEMDTNLQPDIRETENMTFCYQDTYITLEPWAMEALMMTFCQEMDAQLLVDTYLQIKGVGFAKFKL